jgi:hypothetical protein
MCPNEGPVDRDRERWLKRQAIHIAAQLPEDSRDAHEVLRFAEQLVGVFLDAPKDAPGCPKPVVLKFEKPPRLVPLPLELDLVAELGDA